MLGCLFDVARTLDLHGLLELLLIELILGHLLLVAPEVLNSESDSTQLDGVELLDFVIVLAVFVLKRSCH